jgi:hypothetical protein
MLKGFEYNYNEIKKNVSFYLLRTFHFLFYIYLFIPSSSIYHIFCIWITILCQLHSGEFILLNLCRKKFSQKNINFIYEWTYPYHKLSLHSFMFSFQIYLVCMSIYDLYLRYVY